MNTYDELRRLVSVAKTTREAQRAYFRARAQKQPGAQELLVVSKGLEKDLDALINRIEDAMTTPQGALPL